MRRVTPPAAIFAAGILLAPAPVRANPASEALRRQGTEHIYNLDREQAIAAFREATVADPQAAGAFRGLASALWLSITYRRGNMTVDDYLGGVSRPKTPPPPPPADVAAAFNGALDHAIELARKRIERDQKDADAHYQLGAAVGLRASYTATVDGSVLG